MTPAEQTIARAQQVLDAGMMAVIYPCGCVEAKLQILALPSFKEGGHPGCHAPTGPMQWNMMIAHHIHDQLRIPPIEVRSYG